MTAPLDRAGWEQAILEAVAARRPGSTLCPSEVARAHAGSAWRDEMPHVREVAIDMAKRGLIRISQRGVTVADLDCIRGPLRLSHP